MIHSPTDRQRQVVLHRSAATLAPDWDTFSAHHPFAQRRWLAMTEDCFRGYEPAYFEVREDGRIVAAAVLARQRYFNTSAYVPRDWMLPLAHRGLSMLPPISVQIPPFGFSGIIDPAGAPGTAAPRVLGPILRLARRSWAPFVGFNALDRPNHDLVAAGFLAFDADPEAVIDIAWESYADYERSLPKKYREEIRRVRNRAWRSGVSAEVVSIEQVPGPDVERLMRMITHSHGNVFTYDPGLVERALPYLDAEHHRTIVARLDDSVVATVSVFRDGSTGVLKWMGLDYDRAGPAHAYHLVMSEAVGVAIDLGVERLVLGATSYVIKKKLGATLEPRWIYARPTGRVVGRGVALARSALSRPKPAD